MYNQKNRKHLFLMIFDDNFAYCKSIYFRDIREINDLAKIIRRENAHIGTFYIVLA